MHEWCEAAAAGEPNLRAASEVVKREFRLTASRSEQVAARIEIGREISGDSESFREITCAGQIQSIRFEAIIQSRRRVEVSTGDSSVYRFE